MAKQSTGAASRTDMLRDHLPPQNLVAERSALGSMMLENVCVDEVSHFLSAAQFYSDIHGMIYSAILRRHNLGKNFDIVLLAEELNSVGQLEEIGGPPYLLELLETVPHAAHVKYYSEIIVDKWKLRQLMTLGTELVRLSSDQSESTEEAVGKAEATLHLLSDSFQQTNQSLQIGDLLLGALDQRVRCEAGAQTGFFSLDELVNGLKPGQLVVLAAGATVGKSALVGNIATNFVERGDGVLFSLLEMTQTDIIYRLVARLTGLMLKQIISSDIQYHAPILEAMNLMNRWPLFIDDRLPQTVTHIAAVARSLKRKRGIKLVIIDYLQLIEPLDRKVNREQQIAQITRALKVLARQLQLPIIVLSQINRDSDKDNRPPRLRDLRESGAIEQDADAVWFIHRPSMTDIAIPEDEATLIIAKNRQGPRGEIKLHWDGIRFLFRDMGQTNQRESTTPDSTEDWNNG